MSFTPEEIAAQDEAFELHRQGKCPDDCGFCYDLLLAGEEKYTAELRRIQGLKRARKQQSLIPAVKPSKRVGAGRKGKPLAGKMKKKDLPY